MRVITTEIRINAPLSVVWETIFNVSGYNDWNPFVTYVSGEAKEGADLEFKVHLPGAHTTATRVRVLKIVPEREFVWLGHLLNITGIVDGEHSFELFSIGPALTKVVHNERFEGKLLPILGAFVVSRVGHGLRMLNAALKWRAERVYSTELEQKQKRSIVQEDPVELSKIHWDAIIVGTGMGGSTLGYALAKGGQRVLFLEKGENYLTNPRALRGDYMEILAHDNMATSQTEQQLYLHGGRWWGEIYDVSRGKFVRSMLGVGAGGSSALYGMVMERFFPSDFESKKYHPEDTESTLPERWPITYDDLEPFYDEAEKIFQVEAREGTDPLRADNSRQAFKATLPRHESTRKLENHMRKKNLNVYCLPSACQWKTGCHFCQNFLCEKGCKNDAATACLQPALELHGASLVTRFVVDRLESDQGSVTAVTGRWRDEKDIRFHGRRIILAAGALATPLILQRSRSHVWPQGLANRSGAVGRNLMRQLIDLYQLPSFSDFSKDPFTLKENAWNDCYVVDAVKYGTIQCYGKFPRGFMVVEDILFDLRQKSFPWAAKLITFFRPQLIAFLDKLFAHSGFGSIMMEDLPQWENRVEAMDPAPDGRERIAVHYRISPYDQKRLKKFRKMYADQLFPYPHIRLSLSNTLKMMGHVCGTVRFGEDPKTSVLNKMNRAHDVDNLYVVDSSFFPSSGGINPALTIAANALRVAAHILQNETENVSATFKGTETQ